MKAKSAGQILYEADIARNPRYHDGSSRTMGEAFRNRALVVGA